MTYSGEGQSVWLEGYQPKKNARLRLFCFPPAGGSAYQFSGWARSLPAEVELLPVQLPGRGRRFNEEPHRRLVPLARLIALELAPYFVRPYVLLGHSMGALIAFEVARELERAGGPGPSLLMVSGRRGPEVPRPRPPTYNLPDAEFKAELRRMNGTPEEVLNNPQLMELMTPLLRADFESVQTYAFEGPCALRCPVRGYGGLGDSGVPAESLDAWRNYTSAGFRLSMLPGDHFFVFQPESKFLHKLAADLTALLVVAAPAASPGGRASAGL